MTSMTPSKEMLYASSCTTPVAFPSTSFPFPFPFKQLRLTGITSTMDSTSRWCYWSLASAFAFISSQDVFQRTQQKVKGLFVQRLSCQASKSFSWMSAKVCHPKRKSFLMNVLELRIHTMLLSKSWGLASKNIQYINLHCQWKSCYHRGFETMYGKNEIMNMDNEASKQIYFKPIEVKQSKRLQTSHTKGNKPNKWNIRLKNPLMFKGSISPNQPPIITYHISNSSSLHFHP